MCTESACVEPNALDPFANQSRILTRRDRSAGVAATGKQEFARLLVESSHILINGLACLLGQLKPDGLTCFLLTHCRTVNRISVRCDVLDLQSSDIAPRSLLSMATLNMARSRILPPPEAWSGSTTRTLDGVEALRRLACPYSRQRARDWLERNSDPLP